MGDFRYNLFKIIHPPLYYLQSQLHKEQPAQVLSALETKPTFEAGFTLSQIKLLTQCVNQARIFTSAALIRRDCE